MNQIELEMKKDNDTINKFAETLEVFPLQLLKQKRNHPNKWLLKM